MGITKNIRQGDSTLDVKATEAQTVIQSAQDDGKEVFSPLS